MKKALLTWYRENPRDYPWRSDNIDPYVVLVSEMMLQQTQAGTVAKRLPEFLQVFPNIDALSRASNGDMLKAWQGLGYNRRAIRLRDAAVVIRDNHGGEIPNDAAALAAMPGLGAYASAAIVCFAYNRREVVVDVNVRRVYSRYMTRQSTTACVQPVRTVYEFAETIVPRTNASEWHHAVMDLGAHICTARKPLCDSCPLRSTCPSAHLLKQPPAATRKSKGEPMYRGQPNRIWRGRIVKLLHGKGPAATFTHRRLFRQLTNTTATATDLQWLSDILQSLQKEGMLVIDRTSISGMR